jgi:hypothetical protein
VSLNWPAPNDELFNVKLEGTFIWSGADSPPSASILFSPSEQVDASAPIEFHFGLDAEPSGYNLSITFDNGCTAGAAN